MVGILSWSKLWMSQKMSEICQISTLSERMSTTVSRTMCKWCHNSRWLVLVSGNTCACDVDVWQNDSSGADNRVLGSQGPGRSPGGSFGSLACMSCILSNEATWSPLHTFRQPKTLKCCKKMQKTCHVCQVLKFKEVKFRWNGEMTRGRDEDETFRQDTAAHSLLEQVVQVAVQCRRLSRLAVELQVALCAKQIVPRHQKVKVQRMKICTFSSPSRILSFSDTD